MAPSVDNESRVLIVDDNRDVLASLRRTLKRCGFALTCVDNPQEAIDLLGSEPFDLLLSDIDMPGINGHEVMAKAQVLQPTMIRVFVTGAGSMDAAVRAINEGEVHRFVRKPFEAQSLRKLLFEALERKAELDVASEASDRIRRRRKLYRQLEAEHPGITEFSLDEEGCYCVVVAPLTRIADSLGLQAFLS